MFIVTFKNSTFVVCENELHLKSLILKSMEDEITGIFPSEKSVKYLKEEKVTLFYE